MRSTWTLLSPLGVSNRTAAGEMSSRRPRGGVLGFLSNRKPNAAALQRLLGPKVAAMAPELEVRYYEKANSSLGAGAELLDRLAADCGLVINGTGD